MRHPLHDYSGGGYFITFTTHGRRQLLSTVLGGEVRLQPAGRIVQHCWETLPEYYPCVVRDSVVIMPDHVHCIVLITHPKYVGKSGEITPLPEVMRGFKSMSARQINKLLNRQGVSVWQDGYRDRIIRNDRELDAFRGYILSNPARWTMDMG